MMFVFAIAAIPIALGIRSLSFRAKPGERLPEVDQVRAFFNDLYPGRRFRFVWSGRATWRQGFAVPMDEPRFAPVPFECSTQAPSRCILRP